MMAAEIIKFPLGVHAAHSLESLGRRKTARLKNGGPTRKERRRRPKRILTGEDWNEFVRLIGPDLQQEFMVEAWKLINRFWRKL